MEWKRRSAYVLIKTRPGQGENVYNRLKEWDQTIGTFMIHWPYDVMVWFDAENIEETHHYVAEIRSWKEVDWTSTQQVFQGYKSDGWFWEKPAGTWIKIRSNNMYATYDDLKNYDWISTYASVPGDWDCFAYVYGSAMEEVFKYMGELKQKGYEIECFTPYNSYWNEAWKTRWYAPEESYASSR